MRDLIQRAFFARDSRFCFFSELDGLSQIDQQATAASIALSGARMAPEKKT